MAAGADSWLYPSKRLDFGRSANEMAIRLDSCGPKLTRKASKRVYISIRTANQHRCSGREDQGVRVILR